MQRVPGTFEGFQEDVLRRDHSNSVDDHASALGLVNAALITAALMPPAANALYSVADTQDKQGVCHQLVNDERVDWIDE
jgi:hypothetical protein